MHNVLVTGGAGFIGSNFIHSLLRMNDDAQVYNLDALTYAANLESLKDIESNPRYTFIEGNICDRTLLEKIFLEKRIDCVVHFAAETHVDRSITGPDKFIQTNIVGTSLLLEQARQAWLEKRIVPLETVRFHHVSTDEVYGSLQPGEPAFSETTCYAPNSPYAASKAASDHLVRSYQHTYGLPTTISNCSNNYGPFQFPEKLIPLVITNAMHGLPIPVYGDGKQVRDWLFVEDHCSAILKILQEGKIGETYNIGGENQPTNLEIIQLICSLLDDRIPASLHWPHASLIQFVTDRPGHDRRYSMNIQKIKRELNWQPQYQLKTGLEKTVKWYLENEAWTDGILARAEYQNWMETNYTKRKEGC